jgi:hypothetical protein
MSRGTFVKTLGDAWPLQQNIGRLHISCSVFQTRAAEPISFQRAGARPGLRRGCRAVLKTEQSRRPKSGLAWRCRAASPLDWLCQGVSLRALSSAVTMGRQHNGLLSAALLELPLTRCVELVPGYFYGNAAAIKPNNVSTPNQFQRNNASEKARPLDRYFNRA